MDNLQKTNPITTQPSVENVPNSQTPTVNSSQASTAVPTIDGRSVTDQTGTTESPLKVATQTANQTEQDRATLDKLQRSDERQETRTSAANEFLHGRIHHGLAAMADSKTGTGVKEADQAAGTALKFLKDHNF